MNSDTSETALQCAIDAGAIVNCPNGCGYKLNANDYGADDEACEMGVELWKSNARGFRGMDKNEVKAVVEATIHDSCTSCPGCGYSC